MCTHPTRPCFGSILGSVPQNYCINRMTVQDTVYILHVVMMVYCIVGAWLPWQQHAIAWKMPKNRWFCREYGYHKVGQNTVSEDFSTPRSILKNIEMAMSKTHLTKKNPIIWVFSEVENVNFTWFLAVEQNLVQNCTCTISHGTENTASTLFYN